VPTSEAIGPAVILVVDDDPEALELTRRSLERRLATDYQILAEGVPDRALHLLSELADRRTEVALILADMNMPGMSGVDLLARAADIHPDAKRIALITWGELETSREPILRASARGDIEAVLAKPWRDAHESFYYGVAKFLDEWDRGHRPQFQAIRIVGERWDQEAQELRDTLYRSGVPFGSYDLESEQGRALLEDFSAQDGPFPVAIVHDGQVLHRPTPSQIAAALRVNTDPVGERFDVAIVGSGPAGLAAAVYGASEGLDVIVIEHRALGGQASTSSMIRNYLGFPRGLSGADLATRAYRQAWFFGARFLIGRTAEGLRSEGDERVIVLDDGSEVRSSGVVLATGVSYRRLKAERIDELVGRGVFYGAPVTEAPGMADELCIVVGGGNSSAQMSLYLARFARRVIVVTRNESLDEMSDYLVREIESRRNIELRLDTVVDGVEGERRLGAVRLKKQSSGEYERLDAAGLFIMIGAEPRTAWLPDDIERDERGYVLTGPDVDGPPADDRPRALLETSMPGVYAVGDVRQGSLKRIAAAVGEGSSVIRMCHEYFALLRSRAPQPPTA
jgi:thioredoxin reductase (NADPH)